MHRPPLSVQQRERLLNRRSLCCFSVSPVRAESVTSELSGVLAEEEKLETSFQTADQRLQDVCGKRERSSKYANKKERDAELKKTISKVKKQRDETQRQIDRLTGEMNEAQAAADKLEADMSQKEEQMESNRKSVEKVNEQLEKLAKIRDASNDTRKETWKREAERESEMAELKATLDKAQRSLQITMDKVRLQRTRTHWLACTSLAASFLRSRLLFLSPILSTCHNCCSSAPP